MAQYYNLFGPQFVNGTAALDRYYAFTKDDNFDRVNPDALFALFTWTTGIRKADGSLLAISGTDVQISQDVYNSNGGTDVLYGSSRNDAIFFNNGQFADGVGGINGIQQFYFGAGNDIADFSARGNGAAYTKQVLLNGEDGDDTLIGGSNNDEINGGNGIDLLIGNGGGDKLDGGAGNDTIYGDDMGANLVGGQDTLRGRAGDDTLYGGVSADALYGDEDNDTLYGGLSGDTLYGGIGNDMLYGDDPGGIGGDKLFGDAGDDELRGGGGIDQLDGGTGNDRLYGDDADDIVRGRAGNDLLVGGAGNDSLGGDEDIDTALYSGNRADYVTVLNADGSYTVTDSRGIDGTDTLRAVEFLQFADALLSVDQLNYPPVITSDGGGATAVLTIAENTAAVTTITAADQDAGQTLGFGIAGGADAALFVVDAATGLLSFANAPDFENPVDADGDGVYQVNVRAFDNLGGSDVQTLSVTVADAADGAAPVISSDGGDRTAIIARAEGTTDVTIVAAADADGTTPTYRIAGGADAARFSLDAATGALIFLAAPDFEAPADANGDNRYEVFVEATDGLNSDRQQLSIEITNFNDNSPVITSGPAATIDENTVLAATITAVDADTSTPGFAPSFAIIGGDDAARFSLDAVTGALTFITAPDFEAPTDADGNNIYSVIVAANDGSFTAEQSIAITVANLNDTAPVINSNGGAAVAAVAVAENAVVVTSVIAADADGTTPTYRISGGADAALFSLNTATGALAFLAAPDFEAPQDSDLDNIYQVTVEATDGVNIDSQALAISVTDVNEIGRTITGTTGNDTITPTAVAALRTTALNDTIYGLAGNDTIDGGAGEDRMEGGAGNDTYTVDRFSDDGRSTNDDIVVELAGGGTDRVNASVSYRLAAQVENLTLLGALAIDGFGNDLANSLTGNAAANLLSGEAGNDTILGNDGNDTLVGGDGDDQLLGGNGNDNLQGGAGIDRLDGGIGIDTLAGGAGDDLYLVDVWSDDGNDLNDDLVTELAGGGNDRVSTTVSYRLGADVEQLTIAGTAAINGTGNSLANVISGNTAGNVITGLDGNDTLSGIGGDDILEGGAGTDVLDGGIGNDILRGGDASDSLLGQSGADTLIGGTGKDTLTGGLDADIFGFAFGDTTLNTNLDRITDFSTAAGDRIDLDLVSGSLDATAYAEGSIGTNNFTDALNMARSLFAAGGKTAVFVAGSTDGWVFWDGAGGDNLPDQAIVMTGVNSVDLFSYSQII
ncbi:hemolysin [Polymorphobacter glacialis]|uniref:Hemolysin n=1 Tax=Sandarakinorhabdus glacialis TaxID=1614636 RepID=A0A916ZIV6_9SPHN|nr:calcium-binding protein [Polymorphobacter glacialis]GGE00364.1 hemolysin [Polymorphobacter glacialis]